MQGLVALLETDYGSTVAEAMEKRQEISAKPNAAPRSEVERVRRRIDALGIDWHDAVTQAGLSRPTGFRLLNGQGSVASLRSVDEWAAKEEIRLKRKPDTNAEQQASALEEWAELGRQLQELDPARFATTLDGLRDVLESVKLQRQAIHKMFRATPDRDR